MPAIAGLLFHYSYAMRLLFYFITVLLFFSVTSSCTKGEPVKDPGFGTFSIQDFTLGSTRITDTQEQVIAAGTNISLVSGKKKFRFYSADTLLLDTGLTITPFVQNYYYMFRPTLNRPLKIVDSHFNDFDKEISPDSGSVKISFAQFSGTFPGKVNIYLTTETYINNALQQIQVGEFENVSDLFSAYHHVVTGKNQSSRQINNFSLVIKDPVTGRVLLTSPLVLPAIASTGKLISSIYLIYLDANSKVTILMSK